MNSNQLETVTEIIVSDVGTPDEWIAPVDFSDSLALSALNSAHSLRAGSKSVVNLIRRYRDHRAAAGADAETDSGPDLIRVIDEAGGPQKFATDVLQNESKLPGTLRVRAEGIYEGLTNLADLDVTTAEQLRDRADESEIRRAWRSVRGFGKLAWEYLLMNAGAKDRTKADVMIRRYLSRILEQDVSVDQATAIVVDVAKSLNVSARELDRAIWIYESPNGA